jgi:hypothetical protein
MKKECMVVLGMMVLGVSCDNRNPVNVQQPGDYIVFSSHSVGVAPEYSNVYSIKIDTDSIISTTTRIYPTSETIKNWGDTINANEFSDLRTIIDTCAILGISDPVVELDQTLFVGGSHLSIVLHINTTFDTIDIRPYCVAHWDLLPEGLKSLCAYKDSLVAKYHPQ